MQLPLMTFRMYENNIITFSCLSYFQYSLDMFFLQSFCKKQIKEHRAKEVLNSNIPNSRIHLARQTEKRFFFSGKGGKSRNKEYTPAAPLAPVSGLECLQRDYKLCRLNTVFQYKLEQETWLCRTHLDDFVDKAGAILGHSKPYYTILDNFGPFWTRYEPFWTILDNFERFCWTILDNFGQF